MVGGLFIFTLDLHGNAMFSISIKASIMGFEDIKIFKRTLGYFSLNIIQVSLETLQKYKVRGNKNHLLPHYLRAKNTNVWCIF